MRSRGRVMTANGRKTLILALALLAGPPVWAQDTATVVTLNVLHGGRDCDDLDARTTAAGTLLAAQGADLIGLQEVSGSLWRKNRAKILARRLGYHYVYKPSDGMRLVFAEGLAGLSRRPITHSGRQRLVHSKLWPLERRFVQWVETELASGQRILLFNTHLTAHSSHGYQVERLEQALEALEVLDVVAERALARDLPALLVGDFNSEPGHLALRALSGTLLGGATPFVDAWDTVGSGPGVTWSPANPHTSSTTSPKRIDYVLLLQGTTLEPVATSVRVIGDQPIGGVIASDHYGVAAEVELRPRATPTGGLAGSLSSGATPTAALSAAQRAANLRDHVAALRREIAAVRAKARHELEVAAGAARGPLMGIAQPPVRIDKAELRRIVLRRVLALLAGR